MASIILHIDMDAYFTSVEQQANPSWRGKPIAVGGKPGERSIVTAASREAKARGVKTAMSTWMAKKILPQLIIVPANPARYLDASRRIFQILSSFTPHVEIFSIDEAFLKVNQKSNRSAGETGVKSQKYKSKIKIYKHFYGENDLNPLQNSLLMILFDILAENNEGRGKCIRMIR